MTPSLLHQAIVSDGYLSLTKLKEISQSKIDHYVRDNEARDILRIAVKKAKPWKEYLEEWANEALDGTIEELALGLESYGYSREDVGKMNERFASVCSIRPQPKRIRFKQIYLIEKNGCWWTQGGESRSVYNPGQLIMNATLRIDCTELVDDEVVHYVGRLGYEGEDIPFSIPMDELRTRTLQSLQLVLAKARPGARLHIAEGWKSRLVTAAMSFSGFC
jgi:hypothetical protein